MYQCRAGVWLPLPRYDWVDRLLPTRVTRHATAQIAVHGGARELQI